MLHEPPGLWRWLWLTDAGLALRIAFGVGVFAALAIWDLARKGRQATRWKEYLFLFTATAVVMLYGLANDMVTVTITTEYFLEHEGLPLDTPHVRPIAAVVALKATWTPGLIVGVILLLANNPSKKRPQLPYRRMYPKLLYPFLCAGALAFLLGAAAWCGWADHWLGIIDVSGTRPLDVVFYAHTGAYAGGFLGALGAVLAVLWQRRQVSRLLGK